MCFVLHGGSYFKAGSHLIILKSDGARSSTSITRIVPNFFPLHVGSIILSDKDFELSIRGRFEEDFVLLYSVAHDCSWIVIDYVIQNFVVTISLSLMFSNCVVYFVPIKFLACFVVRWCLLTFLLGPLPLLSGTGFLPRIPSLSSQCL